MPSRWMPGSWAEASWPTIASLRLVSRPVTVETIGLIGQGRSVLSGSRAVKVLAGLRGHDDLLGRGPAGAIAELVDRALDPPTRDLPGVARPGSAAPPGCP